MNNKLITQKQECDFCTSQEGYWFEDVGSHLCGDCESNMIAEWEIEAEMEGCNCSKFEPACNFELCPGHLT